MRFTLRSLGGAGPREAGERHAAAALAQVIAVEAVGQITERNPTRRVRPRELPAEARMAKRLGRVGPPEAAQIGLAVAASDHDSEGAIRRHPARRINQVAA